MFAGLLFFSFGFFSSVRFVLIQSFWFYLISFLFFKFLLIFNQEMEKGVDTDGKGEEGIGAVLITKQCKV